MSARAPAAIVAFLALLGAGLIWQLSGPHRFSNDTAQYLNVADNLLASGDLVTTIVIYEVQQSLGMPAAQTVWPPGYPAVIALAAKLLGIDPLNAIRVLNAVAHALAVMLLYATLRRAGCRSWISAAIAGAWAVYFVPLVLGMAGTSEAVYVLALVCMAYSLARAVGPPLNVAWLVAAGCGLAAAYLVRYQAVAYGPALGIAMLLLARRAGHSWVRAFLISALGVAAFAIAFLTVSGRNIYLVGTISGLWMPERAAGPVVLAARGFAQALGFLAWPLPGGTGGALNDQPAMALATVAALLCLLFALVWAARLATTGASRKDAASEVRFALAILTVGGVATTFGLLVHLTMRTSAAAIEARYFAVLIPSLMIATGCLLARVENIATVARSQHGMQLTFLAGLVVLCLITVAQWPARLTLAGQAREVGQVLQETKVGNESLETLLRREGSVTSPILSNQAQLMYHFVRRPAVGVPIRRLSIADNWSSDDIHKLVQRYGVRHVLLFRTATGGGEGISNDFLLLMEREKPAWLSPVISNENVVLLRVVPTAK